MAASRAEVSQKLRVKIRGMVEEGKSNREIYDYVESEYGPDQVAVPRHGLLSRLSYGIPYLLFAFLVWLVFYLGWQWSKRGEVSLRASEGADPTDHEAEVEERLSRLSRKWDNPLSD